VALFWRSARSISAHVYVEEYRSTKEWPSTPGMSVRYRAAGKFLAFLGAVIMPR
jgi:hypothetical protein